MLSNLFSMYNLRFFFGNLVGYLVLACLLSCSDLSREALPQRQDIVKGLLDNGLTYYIKKNTHPANEAWLGLVVNAGSASEKETQLGYAHFVEHMAFRGTHHFPGRSLMEYFEGVGVRFGRDLNAWTSYNETVYKIAIPLHNEEFLNKALLALYDWATDIDFCEKSLEIEKGVIHE